MNFFQAGFLGVVQGLAEFLPISSSGHLVLFQELLGVSENSLIFDVFVHFATLLAVFVYFKKEIFAVTKKDLGLIILASIPAAVVGLLFQKFFEQAFSSLLLVGILLLVSGTFNMFTDRKLKKETKVYSELGVKEALVIGLLQMVAILPGVSRSGSTVFAGVLQNIDRKLAFRFSFLMVIPVVLGANLVQLLKVIDGTAQIINPSYLLVGGFFAFISGMLSLKVFEYVITKAKMHIFGIYCFVMGLITIALSLFGNF